ncbi:MAG TPA: VWA domain-containing protein [Candidatus Tetragenococcus pullicola]|nr:VWA domain-containing protein [Candidatus Tetragenococcus pullicola]
MKDQATELVFVLDKSGSMSGLESDTIGGFNAMLLKQDKISGQCRITTVLFDHNYELLHDRIDISAVDPISKKDYQVGGTTALLDALGQTILKISKVEEHTERKQQPSKVMVVIITDGQENSSREFSIQTVKEMIQRKKTAGWEFIFLGANMDAVETASSYGIDPDKTSDYVADKTGTDLNYRVMSEAVTSFRTTGQVKKQVFDPIREDKQKRGK